VLGATGHAWLTVRTTSSMHWFPERGLGFRIVIPQPLADSTALPQLTTGLGTGEGLGEEVGVGEGLGDEVGDGDGDGDGELVGLGIGDGLGLGEGPVPGTTVTWTDAVARDVPAWAARLYVVVHWGWSIFEPLAGTAPIPLSIWTCSVPSTSQLSVV